MKECTCPVEHTVAKLGHCRSCDAYEEARRAELASIPLETVVAGKLVNDGDLLLAFRCGGKRCPQFDFWGGHDFSWATYSDDHASFGVCACGLSEVDFDLIRMP